MKILLLGRDGQVGRELRRSLITVGEVIAMGRQQADFERPQALRELVQQACPDVIVNAAAYTAVDKAEVEQDTAFRINEEAVRILAEEALALNAWMVHYSTDYVYDGRKSGAYVETDLAQPLSVYGKAKLAGEEAIRAVGCKHLIFRCSWIYSIHGSNFPLAILRRAIEHDQLDVVADSFGAPTSASLIADITAIALYRLATDPVLAGKVTGTYHLAAAGSTSWYEYAKFLVGQAKKRSLQVKAAPNRVFPISASQYQAAAKRPKNSVLDTSKIADAFAVHIPEWHYDAERLVEDLVRTKIL